MSQKEVKINLFYCANCLGADEIRKFCMEQYKSNKGRVTITPISLPCSGKVGLLYLLKTFETGNDGAVIITCKIGECNYLEGNLRATRRSIAVDELLAETGLGKGRMRVVEVYDNGNVDQLYTTIQAFCEQVASITTTPVQTEEELT